MNWGSFKYLVKQGISNIWINRLMSFASIGVLAACLVLIGGAMLLSLNVREVFYKVEGQNEIRAFIEDDVTDEEMEELRAHIEKMDQIATYKFISKDDALIEAQDMMGVDPKEGIFEDYKYGNPIPANYIITLKDISDTQEVIDELEALPMIYKANALMSVVETLTGMEKVLLMFGGIIILVLVLASLVVISNSIRLTVFARRREINIMKYVGATNGFIRLPFVVEGIFVGLIAAVMAFLMLLGIYEGINYIVDESSVGILASIKASSIAFSEVWMWVLAGFAGGGIFIGALGSSGAIRKYLKV
jgi:cell division transport system permease protein